MIAAIYARKSTDQDGVAEDAKSVTRQIENATAFITSRAGPSGRSLQTTASRVPSSPSAQTSYDCSTP
jgi:hypothetical protein